jgi:hypothetical protein
MPIGRRVAKVVFWGIVLCLSILGGAVWYAYWYISDSGNAAKLIREHATRYFPQSILEAARVRPKWLSGEVVFHQVQLRQRIDELWFEALRIPWLHIGINPRKLLNGRLEVRNVEVVQPTLRLRRRRDGTWNLQGLLADPWPAPWIDTPPILIRGATLELAVDKEPPPTPASSPSGGLREPANLGAAIVALAGSSPAADADSRASPTTLTPRAGTKSGDAGGRSPVILRDVELKIESTGDGVGRFKFAGSGRGDMFGSTWSQAASRSKGSLPG